MRGWRGEDAKKNCDRTPSCSMGNQASSVAEIASPLRNASVGPLSKSV